MSASVERIPPAAAATEYRPSAGYRQLLLLLLWAATPTSRPQLLLEATQDGLRFGAVIPPIKCFAAELSWGFTDIACPTFCLRMQMRSQVLQTKFASALADATSNGTAIQASTV